MTPSHPWCLVTYTDWSCIVVLERVDGLTYEEAMRLQRATSGPTYAYITSPTPPNERT